jgi:hypothetical protein
MYIQDGHKVQEKKKKRSTKSLAEIPKNRSKHSLKKPPRIAGQHPAF